MFASTDRRTCYGRPDNGAALSLGAVTIIVVILVMVLAVGLTTRPLIALPLYARQTGQPCAACHTAFPELTPFGRRFELGGYTLGGGDSSLPPI